MVAHLVEELCYKPEGFIPNGVMGFCIYLIFLAALWRWALTQPLAEMSTRDITWCVGLTTLPPLCGDRLEILGVSTPWSLKSLSQPVYGLLYPSLLTLFLAFFYPSYTEPVSICQREMLLM